MRRNNCWLAVLAVSTALPILRHGSARERVPVVYGSKIDHSKSAYHANRGSLHSISAIDETDAIYRDETAVGPVSYPSRSNEPNPLSKSDHQAGWITSSSPDITWQSTTGHANLVDDVNEIPENAGSHGEAKKSVDASSKEDSTESIGSQALQDPSQTANRSLASLDKTQEPVGTSQVSEKRRLSWIYREKVNISPGTIDDVIHKDRETVRETSAIPKGRRGIHIRGRDGQGFRGILAHQGRTYYGHVESSSHDDDTVAKSRGDGETRTSFENSPGDGEPPDPDAGNIFDGVDIGFEGPGVRGRSGGDFGSGYAIGNEDQFGRHVSIGSEVIQTAWGETRGSVRGGVEGIRRELGEQHGEDSLRKDSDLMYAQSRKKVVLEENPDSLGLKKEENDVFSESRKKPDVDQHGSEFFRLLNKETHVIAKSTKSLNIDQQVSDIFRSKKKEARVFSKSRKKLKVDGQGSDISGSNQKGVTFTQTNKILDRQQHFSYSSGRVSADEQVNRQHGDVELRGSAKAEAKTFQEPNNNAAKNQPQFSDFLVAVEEEDQKLKEQSQVLTEEEKDAKMPDKKVDVNYQQHFLNFRGPSENSKEQNFVDKPLRQLTASSKESTGASEQLPDHPQFSASAIESRSNHLVNPPANPKIANQPRLLYLWRPRTRDDRSLYSLLAGKRRDRRNAETSSQQSGSTADPHETGINPAESRSPFEPGSTNRSPERREDEEDISEREEPGTSCKSAASVAERAPVSTVTPKQRSTVNSEVREDNGGPCSTTSIPGDPGTIPGSRVASDRPSATWKNEEFDVADLPGKGFHGLGVANEFLAPSTTTARTPINSTVSLKDMQLQNAALIAPAADPEDRSDTRRAANEDLRVATVAAGNGDFGRIDCAEKNVKLSGPNDRDKDNREPGTDRSNYTANEDRGDRREEAWRGEGCSGENQRNDYVPTDGSDDLKFNERAWGDKGNGQMARATDSGSYDINREDHGDRKSAEERFSEGRFSEGQFSEDYGRAHADDGQLSGKSDGARGRYSVSNGGPGFSMSDKEDGELARKFDYRRNRGDDGEFSGRSENDVGGRGNIGGNRQSLSNEGLVDLIGDNGENGVEDLHDENNRKDSIHLGLKSDIQKTSQSVSDIGSVHSTNHNQDSSNQNNSDKDNQSAWNSEPIYSLNHSKETDVLAEKLHFERNRANNIQSNIQSNIDKSTRTVSNNGLVHPTNHNKRDSPNAEQSARRINRTYAHETSITEPNQSTSNSSPANLSTLAEETVVESIRPPQSPKYQQNETVNESSARRTVSINKESISRTVDPKDNRVPRTKNASSRSTNDTANKNNDAADKEAREEREQADKKAKKEPAVASSMKRSTSKDATKESGNAPTDSEHGSRAIGRNSAYSKSDMNTADVERESRIPVKNDETAGDRLARRKPAKGYPRNSNNSENPEYQSTEAIINPEANETVSRASLGSSKTVAKGAKVESISLEPNYRRGFDEEVNERRVDGLVIVSEGPGSLNQNRESMPDDEPVANLLRTGGLRKEKRSKSSKNFEPSPATLPNSTDSLSADASSKISSDGIPRPTTSGTTEDQSAIRSEIYEPVTSWIDDPVTSADGQHLGNSLESSKTVAKEAESTSLEPDYRPGFDDEINERQAATVIASERSLYQNRGSMPDDEQVSNNPGMQGLRKEKRSKSSKNVGPSSTASPNTTDILSAVASSKISPAGISISTTSNSIGDRSIAPSGIYEPVTSSSKESGPVSWTDSSQDQEVSLASLSSEDLDRSTELDSTVASLENEDDVRLSLDEELAGSDNASSHDLERRNWPVKHSAVVEGDLVLGGLMMVHEREDSITCGPVMPQGGVQALEAMLYTLDWLNDQDFVPGVKIGAHILDDCDKDTYGLEMAVDFIKESREPEFRKQNRGPVDFRCSRTVASIAWHPVWARTYRVASLQCDGPRFGSVEERAAGPVTIPPTLTEQSRRGRPRRNEETWPGNRSANGANDEVMKLLLLALLGVVCSADYEPRDRWPSVLARSREDPELETAFDLLEQSNLERALHKVRGDGSRFSDERAWSRARQSLFRFENPETHHPIRHGRRQFRSMDLNSHVPVTWPVKKEAVVEGDLVLGGLMMVHEREETFVTCGPVMPQGGVQALEAMLYTLDKLNEGEGIVPGVKIGAHILDDCDKDTYGLEMAVDFIKGSISNIDGAEYHCNKTAVRKVISGVVGAASSVTSIQVANLLRLFRIPQVSFFSTSPELSNKQRFEYFARTIPSDHYQVKAMVDIVMKMGWRYVSIIYEESNYGIKAFEELEELLGKNEICIAVKEKLVKDSGVADDTAYDNIVEKLKTKPRARGCIIFGSDQEVAGVMRAVRRCNATGAFSWIGSDGWSARGLVSNGNEPEVEGTLSVQPQANPVRGFEEYFLNLTVENNRRNPWFVEFWEDHFKCRYPNASKTPYNQKYTEVCTTKERLTKQNTAFEDQLQFVSDAVMAFVYAFKAMHEDLCFGKPGLCDAMKPTKGTELLKYLHKVDFEALLQGLSGDRFKFDKNGDGPARYNIIHFKQTEPGKYKWVRVGKYLEGELRLNMSEIQFKLGHPQPPESVCSLPCEVGQAKKYVEGERCCWHCFNCTQYQIRKPDDETQCIPCRQGTVPDETHSTCRDIPEEFLRPESGWAIGAMSFSASGILITFFVCGVFLKHNDTPVVRASGRELSYILLCGILLCYLVTFALVLRPTNIVCSIQRFAAGFCFTVVYAALLTKTNRISRIFNSSKHSAKRPSFISPRSQLIICSGLVFVQILINGVWIIIDPARAMHHYPTREDNLLVCNSYVDASYMIAFAYPIMLIVVCTVYAVLTRKIPEAFNESKHIGFTMYTTCVIWLAFVPLYFGTGSNVALRITSMSVTISLSASVTIACLFSPKLYIILIRPERNVRQSMMPARYSTTKSSAVTATNASSMIAPVTLTAATCDQNKAVKKHIISTIDCWTQSEYYELEVKEQKNGKPTPTVVSRLTQTSSNDLEQSGNLGGKDAKENPTTTSKENASTTTKQLNNNARIGNGPVNQADVSL